MRRLFLACLLALMVSTPALSQTATVLFKEQIDTETELEGIVTDISNLIQQAEINSEAKLEALLADVTNVLIAAELNSEAELEALLVDVSNVLTGAELDTLAKLNALISASIADGAHTTDTRVDVEEDNVQEQADTTALDFGAQFNVTCAAGECDVTVDTVAGVTGADEDSVSLSDVQTATSSDFHNIGGTDDDIPDANEVTADAIQSAGQVDGDVLTWNTGDVLSWDPVAAGHGDGDNCSAGEIPLGVDGSGAVQGCYEPTEADITDLTHTTDTRADAEEANVSVLADPTAYDFQGGFDVTIDATEVNVSLDTSEAPLAALEESAEIDTDITTHAAVTDAHFDHADNLTELNTQISASLADGAHTTDTGPEPDCVGTAVYQDGEGGCDTRNAGSNWENDLEEEGQINATTVTGNAADDQVLLGSGASALGYATIPDCNTNNMLTYTQSTNTFGCDADDGAGGGAPVGVQYVVGASDATLTAEKILTDGTGVDTVISGGDAGAATISLDYTATAAGNPALSAEECVFTTDGAGGGILCEGTTADTSEGLLSWNPTTDKVITIPDATDTLVGRDTTDTLTNKTLTAAANSIEADTGDSATSFFSVGEVEDARVIDALTVSGGSVASSTITLDTGANPTADGQIRWDSTTERVEVGDDGAATLELYPGAHSTASDITMGGDVSGTADASQVDDVQSATANTESADNSTTQVATTAFVQQEINGAGGTDLTCSGGVCNVDNPVTAATTAATANAGDSATSFFSTGTVEAARLPEVGALTTSGGTDKYVLQQTGASTYEFDWPRARSHATDCTGLTDGEEGDFCWEIDANTFYVCEPSAGLCDTPGEWIAATAAGDGVGYDEIQDNDVAETKRGILNLLSGGTVTVSCADDAGNSETDCTFTGSAHFTPTDIDTDYGTETVTAAWTVNADWDFSGGGLEIENGTTPPACTEGQIYFDTDATSGQRLMGCEAGTFVTQGDGGGAAPAFSDITTGTNTAATMTVGTGASIEISGTGTVEASAVNPDGDASENIYLSGAILKIDADDNGTAEVAVGGAGLYMDAQANGGAIWNEASSASNPTIVPRRSSDGTGLGGLGTTFSLIAQGNEVIRGSTGGSVTYLGVASAGTGAPPVISTAGETNVDLSIQPAGTGSVILGGTSTSGDLEITDLDGNAQTDVRLTGAGTSALRLESTTPEVFQFQVGTNLTLDDMQTPSANIVRVEPGADTDSLVIEDNNVTVGTATNSVDVLGSITHGDNTEATLTYTADPTGSTNPTWTYTDGTANLSAGNLQEGGVDVSTGAHFSPTDIDTDYSTETVTSAWTVTGDWDFSGGGLEIENGITPPACTEGQLYMDTDATSGQRLMACEGGTFVVQGDGGGAPGTDSVGTDQLDDDANTPTAGDFVIVETGAASFDYRTPNVGTDVTADLEEEGQINATAVTGNAADDQVILGSGASAAAYATIPDCNTESMLTYTQATNTWGCETDSDSGGTPTQIVAGDSEMTVADAGAGTITATVDASAVGVWDVGGLTIGGADATDTLVLPVSNDATTPTLSFGDEDSGIFQPFDSQINFVIDGSTKLVLLGSYLQSNLSSGGGIKLSGSSLAGPGLLPYRLDSNTGLHADGTDTLYVSAGGVEAARFNTAASGVNYLSITPGITGNGATLAAAGEANVDLILAPAGSGQVDINLDCSTGDQYLTTNAAGQISCGTDDGGAETNNLETTDPPNVLDQEIYIGNGAASGTWNTVTGDASLANTGALTISAGVIEETMMSTEDFGDFSCGGGADDCLLDSGVVDSTAIAANTITADDVAASLDTRKAIQVVIADPDPAAVNYVFRLPPWAGTMTQIDCEAYGGTSVTINICDGEDYLDDTCTTSIPGATMTCTTSGTTDSTLSATGFAARDKVSLVLTAESGSVDRLEVYITATVN